MDALTAYMASCDRNDTESAGAHVANDDDLIDIRWVSDKYERAEVVTVEECRQAYEVFLRMVGKEQAA